MKDPNLSFINDIIALNKKCNKQEKELKKLEKMCNLSLLIILDNLRTSAEVDQEDIFTLKGIFFQAYYGMYKKGKITKNGMLKTLRERSVDFMNKNPDHNTMGKLLLDENE